MFQYAVTRLRKDGWVESAQDADIISFKPGYLKLAIFNLFGVTSMELIYDIERDRILSVDYDPLPPFKQTYLAKPFKLHAMLLTDKALGRDWP